MRKIVGNTLMLILLGLFISCNKGKDAQTVIQDPNEVRISNNDFETTGNIQTPSGWSTAADGSDQDADFADKEGHNSEYCLKHFKNSAYKVFTYQELTGLETGYYSLTAWALNGGGQNACYITAKDYGDIDRMTSLPFTNGWTLVIVRGIHVTNGRCTIGIYSDALPGNWEEIMLSPIPLYSILTEMRSRHLKLLSSITSFILQYRLRYLSLIKL